MIIEYSETDESRVRWNRGGAWKSADIEELIEAYEWKQSIPDHGDLIDRDALCITVGRTNGKMLFAELLKKAPVVIPAERKIDKWWERSGTVDAERSEE